MAVTPQEVFGVNKQRVLSYLEREAVDGFFVKALASDKQIIVYGSSKQGKTSLVDKHLPYLSNVLVSSTPKYEATTSFCRKIGMNVFLYNLEMFAKSESADRPMKPLRAAN